MSSSSRAGFSKQSLAARNPKVDKGGNRSQHWFVVSSQNPKPFQEHLLQPAELKQSQQRFFDVIQTQLHLVITDASDSHTLVFDRLVDYWFFVSSVAAFY
jgi:hypothetical protein